MIKLPSDKQKMEELLTKIRPVIENRLHANIGSTGIQLYEHLADANVPVKDAYFSFSFGSYKVTHTGLTYGLIIETTLDTIDQFDLSEWFNIIDSRIKEYIQKVEEDSKTIEVNGKKYRLIERSDDMPF